jgi:threonine synthase
LLEICTEAYTFEVPIEEVFSGHFIMRLDRGPTASFKDFAAQFMGRTLGRLAKQQEKELLVLTATSGDTGSAIAHAFYGIENIRVVILFPVNEVSSMQRKQMTTLGKNITTIALNGKFDDCQALVKRAFSDKDLAGIDLSSANSINIGRLLPQMVYYIYAASRLADISTGEKVVFSIPSGNFGNLMGGILAYYRGLPVKRFVVATNENDEVPVFLRTGTYKKIVPSRECISNAMNVGHPSNLARLVDLYGGHLDETGVLHRVPDIEKLRADLYTVSIGDNLTRRTIKETYDRYKIILEPHGAVGWAGLKEYEEIENEKQPCISLETAHPAKFSEEIKKLIHIDPPLPPSLRGIEELPEHFQSLENEYGAFKEFILKEFKR